MKIGDHVRGATLITGHTVVGELGEFDPRENTMQIKTAGGTYLCRPESVALLQPMDPTGSPGAIRYWQMCPENLRHLLQPAHIVPF